MDRRQRDCDNSYVQSWNMTVELSRWKGLVGEWQTAAERVLLFPLDSLGCENISWWVVPLDILLMLRSFYDVLVAEWRDLEKVRTTPRLKHL